MTISSYYRMKVRFSHSPVVLLNKTVFLKAIYCFRHCYLYPRTVCIMKDGAVGESYPAVNEAFQGGVLMSPCCSYINTPVSYLVRDKCCCHFEFFTRIKMALSH